MTTLATMLHHYLAAVSVYALAGVTWLTLRVWLHRTPKRHEPRTVFGSMRW